MGRLTIFCPDCGAEYPFNEEQCPDCGTGHVASEFEHLIQEFEGSGFQVLDIADFDQQEAL